MAAMFFQGTLGRLMVYSQIDGSCVGAQPGPQGQPPGATGIAPDVTSSRHGDGCCGYAVA